VGRVSGFGRLGATDMTAARRFDLIAFDWDGTLFD